MKIKVKQYSAVILGLFLVAVAFNVFLSPYNLVAGGVSGFAIIIRSLFQINESITIYLINIFLVLMSFRLLGKDKTKNTLLGSFVFPLFVSLTSGLKDLIILDLDPLIIAILGGAISGFGYGLVFRNNFTTGGTDILNQLVEKYLKIPMAKSIMMVDGPIVLLGCISFGIPNTMYALVALALISYLSNNTMLELNKNRVLYITTRYPKEIKEFLMQEYYYDVTILNTEGGYKNTKRKMLMCSVNEKDYYIIKEGILLIDENAFIVATKSYEQKNANKTLRSKLTL